MADLLAAEEAARFQRLEDGYESEDSLAGDEDDEDEDETHPLDAEFSRGNGTQPDNLSIHRYYSDILEGDLSDITDSEDEEVPPFTTNSSSSLTSPIPILTQDPRHSLNCDKPVNSKRKANRKSYKKSSRNAKRLKTADGPYSKGIGGKRVNDSEVVLLDIDATSLPVASTGYQGIRAKKQFTSWTRKEVFQKLRYINWDGR